MSAFNNFLQRVIDKNPIQSVLDLGFGSGRDMIHLKRMGLSVAGIDGCENFVSFGKNAGLDVHHEILPDIKGEYKKYDLIYSVGVLFHLKNEDHQQVIDWIKDHLTPGGCFVISYNELNRENDTERFFVTLKKEILDQQVGLPIYNEEIMKDKRDIEWITTCYRKEKGVYEEK
jgi:2-polyprenyl-3-methyl-5-hydroxy-6-metoxy-1,4-benzoquinol methylase